MENRIACKLRLLRFAGVAGLLVLLAVLGSSSAKAKQPSNLTQLVGTWTNTKADGGLVDNKATKDSSQVNRGSSNSGKIRSSPANQDKAADKKKNAKM